MSKTSEDRPVPAWLIPLESRDIFGIGVIAVLWSQTEAVLDLLLMMLFDDTLAEYQARTQTMMMGGKIDLLKEAAKSIQDGKTRGATLKAQRRMSELVSRRNQVIHGAWWHLVDERGKDLRVAAKNGKQPYQPVSTKLLRALQDDTAEMTRLLDTAFALLQGYETLPDGRYRIMFWGHNPTPPDWLHEVSTQLQTVRRPPHMSPRGPGKTPRKNPPSSRKQR